MPRNLRNFWAEVETTGSSPRRVATGPIGKDGVIQVKVFRRNDGEVDGPIIVIEGYEQDGGQLVLNVFGLAGERLARYLCSR